MSEAPATASVPPNEYERFLAALPEPLRKPCRDKLAGSKLAANHPVFQALAEWYEEETKEEPARNFIAEAELHAGQSKQLLAEFQNVPGAIMGRIEPQLNGLMAALNGPLNKLEAVAARIAAPGPDAPLYDKPPQFERRRDWLRWWSRSILWEVRSTISNRVAWIVTGSICLTLAVIVAATILFFGAARLSRFYDDSYQQRLAQMQADSVEDTVALQQLIAAKIALKVRQSPDDPHSFFLILPGAHKAAQPVNSPEGLAVEVWP
jgi:hypothetical protein